MGEEECMLSTVDNPYDPFTQWDEWLAYDYANGHHTCEYLARVSVNSTDLSEKSQQYYDNLAMLQIVREDPIGIYIIVTPNTFKKKSKVI